MKSETVLTWMEKVLGFVWLSSCFTDCNETLHWSVFVSLELLTTLFSCCNPNGTITVLKMELWLKRKMLLKRKLLISYSGVFQKYCYAASSEPFQSKCTQLKYLAMYAKNVHATAFPEEELSSSGQNRACYSETKNGLEHLVRATWMTSFYICLYRLLWNYLILVDETMLQISISNNGS